MRPTRWWCCALVALAFASGPARAYRLGPQVTLEGDAIPLREVLDRLGRQLNRQLQAGWTGDPRLAKTYAFKLRRASPRVAVETFERVTGHRLRGQSRFHATVEWDAAVPRCGLGKPLGPFVVWLEEVRRGHHFTMGDGRDAQATTVNRWLAPRLTVQAGYESELLGLVQSGPLVAVTDAGAELRPMGDRTRRWYQWQRTESGLLALDEMSLPLGSGELRLLRRLDLELVVQRLRHIEFTVDQISRPGTTLLTEDDVDLRCETSRGSRPRLSIAGALPAGLDDQRREHYQQMLRREATLEAQYFTADGEPRYTEVSGVDVGVQGKSWTLRCAPRFVGEERTTSIDRLVVRLHLPLEQRETHHVVFDDVPVPPGE
jgi:hypothetical protein